MQIDLQKSAREERLPQWHVGGAHAELMVWPGAANYAQASREIVFSTEVPDSVTEQYPLAWTCKAAFRPPGHKKEKGQFPTQKEFSLTELEMRVIELLEGSTAPLKVKCEVEQTNKRKESIHTC